MSVEVSLLEDTAVAPAVVAGLGAHTSNVTVLWHLALGQPLAGLTGRRAGDCTDLLEGAFGYLHRVLVACREQPKAVVRVRECWAPYSPAADR